MGRCRIRLSRARVDACHRKCGPQPSGISCPPPRSGSGAARDNNVVLDIVRAYLTGMPHMWRTGSSLHDDIPSRGREASIRRKAPGLCPLCSKWSTPSCRVRISAPCGHSADITNEVRFPCLCSTCSCTILHCLRRSRPRFRRSPNLVRFLRRCSPLYLNCSLVSLVFIILVPWLGVYLQKWR